MGKWQSEGEYANGGADQFGWNWGEEAARQLAALWRAVGAIENADLLDRLASELSAFRAEVSR